MTDFSGVNRKARNPEGNPKRARLLWNSENREHMKNFGKVDCVAAKKMQFIWVSMYLAGEYFLGTLFLHGTAILRGHPRHAKV